MTIGRPGRQLTGTGDNLVKKLFLAALALLALSGCAANPPLNFTVPNVGLSPTRINAEVKSLTVTLARPDEKKGDMPAWAQTEVPSLWQTALIEAINKMVIFRDDAPHKLNLSVKVLALDVPGAGISFTTKTIARYELTDRDTGAIVFTQDISSEGYVSGSYAFAGFTRARESVNRSVQNNISQFLGALGTANVDKPMFPGRPVVSP